MKKVIILLIAIILVSSADELYAQKSAGVIYTGAIGIRKRKKQNECFFMLWACKRKQVKPVVVAMADDGIDGDWGADGSDEAKSQLSDNEGVFVLNETKENILRLTVISNLTSEYDKLTTVNVDEETIIEDEVISLLGYKFITLKSGEYEIKTDGNGRKFVEVIIAEKN